MKSYQKKNSINPEKLKIIISCLIAIIFGSFMFFAYSFLMNHFSNKTKAQYEENYYQIVDGYSEAILYSIENYKTALKTFYNEVFFAKATPTEIQDYIIQSKSKNHEDFRDLFYVDKTGTAYSQKGIVYKVLERDYYNAIIKDGEEEYLSSPISSKIDGENVLVIAKAVKDSRGITKGAICASVKLKIIQKITARLTVETNSYFVIIDENGRFVSHPDSQWLFQVYEPKDSEFKIYSSLFLAHQKSGYLTTLNTKNQPIKICFRPISKTRWILALIHPLEKEIQLNKNMNFYKFIVILIGIITMILLVFCEFNILDSFQKKQLLKTDYDSLTQLWTRQRFESEATKLIKKFPNNKFMIIETDIRGFKFINENYGEEQADKLLKYISKIVNKYSMEYKGISGRGFADHFYTFIKVSSVHNSMAIFKDMLNHINEEVKMYEIPFFLKSGISFLMPNNDTKGATIQGLIGQASFAKSTIKNNLTQEYAVYNAKLLHKINEEQFIEAHMEQALENHEFFLMFQPKIDLKTDKIVGAEALVRWNNKEMGTLRPDQFIPLFERNGFITKLDFYVYEEVFKFLEKQVKNKEKIVPISVNMSRNHNKPEKFMHNFLKIFKKYNITPDLVQLEILERSVMDNNTLRDITNSLHKEGFSVAIDDFGSGESSLNMLTKIPVDVLKFDKEFLSSSTNENGELDKKSASFIEILVDLSKHLDKKIVFEGVETKAQCDFLKSIDCDQAQGYFYSCPLITEDFVTFIKNHS